MKIISRKRLLERTLLLALSSFITFGGSAYAGGNAHTDYGKTGLTIGGELNTDLISMNPRDIFKYKNPGEENPSEKLSLNGLSNSAAVKVGYTVDSELAKFGVRVLVPANTSNPVYKAYWYDNGVDPLYNPYTGGIAQEAFAFAQIGPVTISVGQLRGAANYVKAVEDPTEPAIWPSYNQETAAGYSTRDVYNLSASLLGDSMITTGSNFTYANKILMAVEIADGLNAAASLTPNTSSYGPSSSNSNSRKDDLGYHYAELGLNYSLTLPNDLSLNFSIAGEYGTPKNKYGTIFGVYPVEGGTRKNLGGIEVAAKGYINGFIMSALYANQGKSMTYTCLTEEVTSDGITYAPLGNPSHIPNSSYAVIGLGYRNAAYEIEVQNFNSRYVPINQLYSRTGGEPTEVGIGQSASVYNEVIMRLSMVLAKGVTTSFRVALFTMKDHTQVPGDAPYIGNKGVNLLLRNEIKF